MTGDVQRWLMEVPHVEDGGEGFATALAGRLIESGLPLWRVSYALMTKHPEVLWRTVQWKAGAVVVRDGADVVEAVRGVSGAEAARIGAAGRRRVLGEHTYDRRAVELDRALRLALARHRAGGRA